MASHSSEHRFPAEWEPHGATWIAWPHHRPDWEEKMEAVQWDYVEIVRHLARGEEVDILVQDRDLEERARTMLRLGGVALERVLFHAVPTDRGWLRDSGPIIVRRGAEERVALDWRFNGWARYDNWKLDDRVASRIASIRGLECVEPVIEQRGTRRRVVLEGGAIDVDGEGTLLTTEECLLDGVQARNPGVSRDELERVFRDYLGVQKTIWLGRGIAGDDTHGHVDDIARFVAPATVVAVFEEDTRDENHEPLVENLERLERATDARGRRLRVVRLPMPRPRFFDDERLPASYANFYIADHAVLVPTFNDPADRVALDTIAGLFPSREVVGIHALNLVVGQGTLHCLTQQEPA